MAELKTKATDADVDAFLNSVEPESKRTDCFTIKALMEEATGAPAQMWGSSIVGFGRYRYKYASGREGEWMITGFAPRKQNLTLYIMAGFDEYDDLMTRLGKHTTGKSCLYVKKLADVDMDVLRALVEKSVAHMVATNSASPI